MLTPRRAWPAVSMTPVSGGKLALSNAGSRVRGKTAASFDAPPPPLNLLGENVMEGESDSGDMEDWRRFREAGLLDVAAMERKDEEALVEKISRLQNDLIKYQHNMGLLLMEKRQWFSEYEELSKELTATEEILKREHSADLIALSEVERREENLKKSLGFEKQRVADLEKALHEESEQCAQTRVVLEKKLADATSLAAGMKEKFLEMKEKLHERLHVAEAKVDEASRKNIELEIKQREIQARESVLQKERLSLMTEQEAREATILRQKDELCQWEQKLQERGERLSKACRSLDEREHKANAVESVFKQRERDVEEMEKNIDMSSASLKVREDSVNKQLMDLEVKEKESDSARSSLETKQMDLLLLEENLSKRDGVVIQEFLDDQNAILERKSHEFELELEKTRGLLENKLKTALDALHHKETEIKHEKEKLVRREKALEKKSIGLREKENDLETTSEMLREKEKLLKSGEEKLGLGRQQMLIERESLKSQIVENEKTIADSTLKELQISEEVEQLGLSAEERSKHMQLQSDLKQEMEAYRLQNLLLLAEYENLKVERNSFDKEKEVLNEKKSEINKELKKLDEEREELERLQILEIGTLEEQKQELQVYIQKELKDLELDKESFASTMRHEQMMLSERAQDEHNQMLQDFETQRRTLKIHLQNQLEEMEKRLQEREKAVEDERKKEHKNINYLNEIVQRERKELASERHELDKLKEVVALNRRELNTTQLEIDKDIDMLNALSRELKDQREQLFEDKCHFTALIDKQKCCKNCGENRGEFISNLSPGKNVSHDDKKHADVDLHGRLIDCHHSELKNVQQKPDGEQKSEENVESADEPFSREGQGGSYLFQKALKNSSRKRYRSQTSGVEDKECDSCNKSCSDGVADGDRRKRQQTIALAAENTGKKLYNPRQHKIAGAVAATQTSDDQTTTIAKAAENGLAAKAGPVWKPFSALSTDVHDRNNQPRNSVPVSCAEDFVFPGDRVAKFNPSAKVTEDSAGISKPGLILKLNNGVNGNSNSSEEEQEEESTSDDDEDKDENPGEVSIGRKILTFFIT